MRLTINGARGRSALRAGCSGLVLFLCMLLSLVPARGAEAPATPPTMDSMMSSQGWLQEIVIKLEDEAIDDVHMLPETPGALAREWRSFDRQGSALGALVNLGWVAIAACLALLAQTLARRALSIRIRHLLRMRPEEPSLGLLLLLLLCDLVGLGVFSGVFIYSRHWLMSAGVAASLIILSAQRADTLARLGIDHWHCAAPRPPARLIDLPDGEARRLAWFLSAMLLVVITLVGFVRYYPLMEDQASGASHV